MTYTRRCKHTNKLLGNVLVDNPDIRSAASGILLKKFLSKQDQTIVNPFVWMKFRYQYLTNILNTIGHIQCHYCKRDNLLITSEKLKEKATIDHIIPVSKGGDMWDVKNLVPACYNCNKNKGDNILDN